MKTLVSKWGNSLAVRIPKPFAIETGMDDGSEVEIIVRSGKLILSPQFSLSDMLSLVNDKNIHPETNEGESIGSEQW